MAKHMANAYHITELTLAADFGFAAVCLVAGLRVPVEHSGVQYMRHIAGSTSTHALAPNLRRFSAHLKHMNLLHAGLP
jgi:hypothetical protein